MQRILLAIGGAAVFCAAVTVLLQMAVSRGLPATEIMLVTASATLLLAIAAAAFAYRAFNRANLVAAELERLTRSMDAAIKDVSLRSDRDSAKLEDLNTFVSGRIDALAGAKSSSDSDVDAPPAPRQDAVDLPAQNPKTAAAAENPETAEIDVALRRLVVGGQPELSLQPIIAAGRGEAGGFEVHVHVQPGEGKPVDIRRLDRRIADVDPAAYERLVVVAATEAVRRRLGDISETKPLHVAVSAALLQDGLEFATVLDIFKLHPSLAKSIVVSVPTELLETRQHSAAIELLSNAGVRVAAEDWAGSQDALDKLRKLGVTTVKIAAERLLDRAKTRKNAPNGASLVATVTQADMAVVATDVASEEDAVSLIDMGVDLMTGARLSAPRRLKGDGPGSRNF
jgi:cyclic-di-GMP phosphodiesterase TipF (flagellum assembly factor)